MFWSVKYSPVMGQLFNITSVVFPRETTDKVRFRPTYHNLIRRPEISSVSLFSPYPQHFLREGQLCEGLVLINMVVSFIFVEYMKAYILCRLTIKY